MGPFRRSALAISLAIAALPTTAQELTVTPSFATSGTVTIDDPVTLELSREVPRSEGRVAVLVGRTDYTGLFENGGTTLLFRPEALPLPLGATEVAVFVVSERGGWREIGRFPLEVRERRSFERAAVTPTLDLLLNAQLDESHAPLENAPPRETFQDLGLQLALKTEHARGDFVTRNQVKLVGASYEQQALRFAERGVDAPRLDLAGYGLDLAKGALRFRLGDVSVGRHRHLGSSFASRGATLGAQLGESFDVTLAAANGTRIVGWDNFLGLDTPEHRILSGTLGVELDPGRPGAARLEASLLDGSVLPLASYNQGLVNDAEESEGFGLRLAASDPGQRLRVEGSFARSTFRNPEDPALAQGAALVPVEETTSDARYARVAFDLLSALPVGETRDATLTLSAEHERVDPLYRSVGSPLRGDQRQNTVSAVLALGEVSAAASHARAEDNLDEIPSILKTFTRTSSLDVSVPFASLAAGDREPSPFVPSLSYAFGRVHQLGGDLPAGGGFNESHVPDQVSLTHNGSLTFEGSRASLTYSLSFSSQDNRQPGRESADFEHLVHSLSLAFFESETLDLGLELSRERGESAAFAQADTLRRAGLSAGWRHPGGFGLNAFLSASATRSENEVDGELSDGRNTEIDVQLSWRFHLRSEERKPTATMFVRFARQKSLLEDFLFGFDEDLSAWQLGAGLSLSAF
jgi:hypothetical protein